MYSHEFVCSDIQKKRWWQFTGHRWIQISQGYILEIRLSEKISKELAVLNTATYNRLSHQPPADVTKIEKKKDSLEIQGFKIGAIIKNLKTQSFRSAVMEACARRFYVPDFETKLDCNRFLIGFENGVYDLYHQAFRSGSPDDNISFSVGYDYVDYSPDDDEIKEIHKFFSQIQTSPEMKEYILRLIASYLVGENKEQQFIFLTGSGCHAKNTKILMADGTTKLVQNIRQNEKLMGDDLKPRNVLQLFRGNAYLYKISLDDGSEFVVNNSHRLAVMSIFEPQPIFDEKKDKWIINWQLYMNHTPIKRSQIFNDKRTALIFLNKLYYDGTLIRKNDIIPISVKKYLEMDESIRKYYKCFRIKIMEDNIKEYIAKNDEEVDIARKMGHLVIDKKISNDVKEIRLHDFIIQKIEKNRYFGFEVDGNSRYLLSDGLVTYNSNGKSVLVNLMRATFGEQYYGIFNPTILTKKRTMSSNATPDIAEKKGKRIVVIQEPDFDDVINAGILKEMTGGDTITARQLYTAPITFKPQFKLLMTCNKLPEISSIDGGTWRRIRVVPFESKFVDEPKKPNEFKKIYGMENIVQEWKNGFMWLLINKYYRDYVDNGLQEPEKVKIYTTQYQKDSNMFYEFITETIDIVDEPENTILINEFYAEFSAWFKLNKIGTRPNKRDLINYMLDKGIKISGNRFTGIKRKENN